MFSILLNVWLFCFCLINLNILKLLSKYRNESFTNIFLIICSEFQLTSDPSIVLITLWYVVTCNNKGLSNRSETEQNFYIGCSRVPRIPGHIPEDTPPSSCHMDFQHDSDHRHCCNSFQMFRHHILWNKCYSLFWVKLRFLCCLN